MTPTVCWARTRQSQLSGLSTHFFVWHPFFFCRRVSPIHSTSSAGSTRTFSHSLKTVSTSPGSHTEDCLYPFVFITCFPHIAQIPGKIETNCEIHKQIFRTPNDAHEPPSSISGFSKCGKICVCCLQCWVRFRLFGNFFKILPEFVFAGSPQQSPFKIRFR